MPRHLSQVVAVERQLRQNDNDTGKGIANPAAMIEAVLRMAKSKKVAV